MILFQRNSTMPGTVPSPNKELRLTARQKEVLQVIQRALVQTGAPPTRAEIATELGFRSANAAEEHLQALARKGAIELLGGTARGIRLRNHADVGGLESFDYVSKTLDLPLIGRVAAGSPMLAQEHIDSHYRVQAGMFEQQPDYLLRVKGQSMQGVGIMDGDLLAVKKTSEAKNGQIIVARLDDEVTVKRFYQSLDKGSIELRAENPLFQTIEVAPDQPFAIEGLAVGLIRSGFSL